MFGGDGRGPTGFEPAESQGRAAFTSQPADEFPFADRIHWAALAQPASRQHLVQCRSYERSGVGAKGFAVLAPKRSVSPLGSDHKRVIMSADFPTVAFNVLAGSDFAGIKKLLNQGNDQGWWHYDVGCGTDEWWNA